MQRKSVVEETFFFSNYYSPPQGLPPPAASLRLGRGQEDLAPEELKTMERKTGLEETILKLKYTSTEGQPHPCHIPHGIFNQCRRVLEIFLALKATAPREGEAHRAPNLVRNQGLASTGN